MSVIARYRASTIRENKTIYPISVIISAYKEESIIRKKIENTLAQDYPKSMVEIIVCSDGDDNTQAIVNEFKKDGVISLHSRQRLGKAQAINRGLSYASHEIVCFTDANCLLKKNALYQLTRAFSSPQTGGVCGRKVVLKDSSRQSADANHMFWQLELIIKSAQSNIDSITTGDGELFALRKNAVNYLENNTVNDDTALTLMLTAKKLKVKYSPSAICYEDASSSLREEFHVKSRIAYGHLQIISQFWSHILKSGPIFTFNFFSHKIIRHLMPYLVLASIISGAIILDTHQLLSFALYTSMIPILIMLSVKPFSQGILNFLLANLAILDGSLKFLKKSSSLSIWMKDARQ